MITRRSRYDGDTHPSVLPLWLLYLTKNTWQIFAAAFWVAVFTAAVGATTTVEFRNLFVPLSAMAGISYMLLLVAPARRWVRVFSLVAPVLAAWSRATDFLTHDPVLWNGTTAWTSFTFIFLYAGARFLPPPLRNGARLAWLRGEGIRGD